MNEPKTKIRMKVLMQGFEVEIEGSVHDKDLGNKIMDYIEVIGKTKAPMEKIFGKLTNPSMSKKPNIKANIEHPLENLSQPMLNLARHLALPQAQVMGCNLFGFKGDKPQIYNPAEFRSANTATRAILFLFEVGLEREAVTLEELKEAYNHSKIKGRTVPQIVHDLIKTTQIDSSKYRKNKQIVLSAKGINDAKKELQYLLGSKAHE